MDSPQATLPGEALRRGVAPRRGEAPIQGVVVAGHLCLDLFPDLSQVPEGQFMQLFRPGHMVSAGPAIFSTGGAVSNTGLALARLGIPVKLVGRVGDDPFGAIVRDVIRRNGPGLEEGILTVPDTPTSYTVIISAPGVDRIFLHCGGANDSFRVADLDFGLVEQAAIFHFGYPPLLREFYRHGGREMVELFRRAQKAGATTSLDLTLPDPVSEAGRADWLAILRDTLPYVDIFLPSVEETLFMLRRQTYDALHTQGTPSGWEAAGGDSMVHNVTPVLQGVTPELLHSLSAQLLELGVKIAGLKLGERGIYLRTAGEAALASMGRGGPADPAAWANRLLWAPGFQVEVVGTTGAGDAAIAGFLSGLLRGLGPGAALNVAAAAGACNVEAADALGGLRSWEEIRARVAAGWPRRVLDPPPAGWDWDAENGVWVGNDREVKT